MSLWLVWVTTGAYAYTSGEQFYNGNTGTGLMFLGYTIANLGIMKVLS